MHHRFAGRSCLVCARAFDYRALTRDLAPYHPVSERMLRAIRSGERRASARVVRAIAEALSSG